MPATHLKRCPICGKPVLKSHSKYCPTCHHFYRRMRAQRLPHWVAKTIWAYVREYGYVCHYTGVELDLEDVHSAWYCVFDHADPRDKTKVVITCAMVNAMKCDLTEEELWSMIRQLANFKRWHTPVEKIKLRYWQRKYTGGCAPLAAVKSREKCDVCGKRIFVRHSQYCPVCAKFAARLHSKHLSPETIEETLSYLRKYGYKCYYTGMPLELNDASSPWYCVYDHWIPHNPQKIVVTSALVNQMKSDLSEKEFWYYILQFADYKEKGKKVRKKKTAYWYRLYPVKDIQGV